MGPKYARLTPPRLATRLRPDAVAGSGPDGARDSPRAEAEELLLAHRRPHRGDVSHRRSFDRARHEPIHGGEIRQYARRREHLRAPATTQHRYRPRVR